MQVSSMVRVPGRDEHFEAQLRQHHHQQQQIFSQQRSRAHDPHPQVAQALVSNPYSNQHSQSFGYGYQQRPTVPQSPPSPPSEDLGKPSLPSISSLLGIADVNPGQQQQVQTEQQQAVMVAQSPDYHTGAFQQPVASMMATDPKMTLPPTPPLGPESILEGNQSPSATSIHSTVSAPPYFMNQANGMDANHHRHSYSAATSSKRPSIGSQSGASSYAASPYSASPYGTSQMPSSGPYYSTDSHMMTSAGLYGQRPLPSNFPPPVNMPLSAGPTQNGSNPWQHHHYISASSQAAFPQSQDRYICPTCNKAFSRPSSLRIHSHSHTGEKPFKCSHAGCGKAFSVRSNMKRHERGCHASTNPAIATSS